ncbi:MAG: rRNA maturation RNase YbeY [Candidatus Aminicenantes bacterium]|nr:rRNA maturation RNase YbeY [Candidatus Aminicenantes bacterium]MDH5744725.1 rRNA maturation RNase YbeY [Candidatus Aminicenantes bacterium]
MERLVDQYQLDSPEITLAFVNNRTTQELNRKFLNKNAPTDVLSFPIREKGADEKYYLGDIIISVQKALDQSSVENHSLERELEILIIHGFLHLMGFEHSKGLEREEAKIRNLMLEG